MKARVVTLGCVLALATPLFVDVTAQVAAPRAPVTAVTQHTGTFNGETIKYTATVGGDLHCRRRRRSRSHHDQHGLRSRRREGPEKDGRSCSSSTEVLAHHRRHYIWAPSAPGCAGCRGGLRDNPFSPLDAVDLVFVDPIGTGLSRPLPGVDGQPFWSVSGDGASVKTFIETWLKANGRESSPRFLCGESYGTVRAGADRQRSQGPHVRWRAALLSGREARWG